LSNELSTYSVFRITQYEGHKTQALSKSHVGEQSGKYILSMSSIYQYLQEIDMIICYMGGIRLQ